MKRIWLRGTVFAAGSALVAGCQFTGLNSLPMPGTAGHGFGAYQITVELADVATLPQNSPVMVDDVTVGSVAGVEAKQRPDGWILLCRGEIDIGQERGAAGEFDRAGGADLAAGLPARRVGGATESAAGGQAGRRLGHSGVPNQSLPDHRGSVLRARCRESTRATWAHCKRLPTRPIRPSPVGKVSSPTWCRDWPNSRPG